MLLHPLFDFEWNAAKAAANLKKHGVSFEEAACAFSDEFALVVDNPEHSDDEPRLIVGCCLFHSLNVPTIQSA